ncbi:hypothetical protein CC2G_003320 [Coprinopsis cinerea AmutBmut pab1-1]|nr:hypothetical protein CC2G_003320 [Coprinopsis cinerea AmutBmut pab1-1]
MNTTPPPQISLNLDQILATQRLLLLHFNLPSELVVYILDLAEYWMKQSTSKTTEEHAIVAHNTNNTMSDSSEPAVYAEKKYLSVPPVSGLKGCGEYDDSQLSFKPRKVIFRLRSCDQGRSGFVELRGTYQQCWSWFEVGIKSTGPLATIEERRWHLQYNAHASRYRRPHEIIWEEEQVSRPSGVDYSPAIDEKSGQGSGAGFLEALTAHSEISLYACAKFPGWENHVYNAEVDVFYHLLA